MNRLYNEKIGQPDYQPGDTLPQFAYRRICNNAELSDIVNTGFMLPREGKVAKYFTLTDSPLPPAGIRSATVIRVLSKNVPFDAPVKASDVELWNNEKSEYYPLTAA